MTDTAMQEVEVGTAAKGVEKRPAIVAASGEAIPLTWWERVSFGAVHAICALLLKVLGVRGLYRFGRVFGAVEYLINFKRRRRFAAVLKHIWGRQPTEAERRRHTREFFMRVRCDKLFYLVFDCIPRERVLELFSIRNKEVLDKAIAQGRGVYVATSHHGSMHVAGLLMSLTGYRIAGVRDRNESAIRRYVQRRLDLKYPEFQRARVLYADSYPREIFRCFQEQYIIGSSMDVARVRQANQKVEMVTVFGEERPFLSGPLHIALRCRAPILQGFIIPERGFRYRFDIVGELLPPEPQGDQDQLVRQAIELYAANVERYLRETPSLTAKV